MFYSKNRLCIGKMILNLRKAVEKLGTISNLNKPLYSPASRNCSLHEEQLSNFELIEEPI